MKRPTPFFKLLRHYWIDPGPRNYNVGFGNFRKPVVRKFLLVLQRYMAKEKGVVFEGRDMGTVVFPAADVKFFLNASQRVRALRRHRELDRKTGQTIGKVERDLQRRDENDSNRPLAPLKPAEGSIHIDSTHLSIMGGG